MSRASNSSQFLADSGPIGRRWCYTSTKLVKFAYNWTIDKYSRRTEKIGECLVSPRFTFAGSPEGEWQIEIYPNGSKEEAKKFVSLFLKFDGSSTVSTEGQFSILSPDGNSIFSKAWSSELLSCSKRGFVEFMDKDQLTKDKLLFEDTLTILCEISVIKEPTHQEGPNQKAMPALTSSSVTQDLGILFRNKKFADVIFQVDGVQYHVHRAMLAARSPVFSAMFENNLSEQREGQVQVVDISNDVFLQMLNFIYTDSVPRLEEFAVDLLRVADKYDLKGLKAKVESQLCSDLCVERACEILTAADSYNSQHLKLHALDYVCVHSHTVILTPGWKHMMEQSPELLAEACAYIVAHK